MKRIEIDSPKKRFSITASVWAISLLAMVGLWYLLLPSQWEILPDRYTIASNITPFYDVALPWLILGAITAVATYIFGNINLTPLALLYPILYGYYGANAIVSTTSMPTDHADWSVGLAVFLIFPICLFTIILIQKTILDEFSRSKQLEYLKYFGLIFFFCGLIPSLDSGIFFGDDYGVGANIGNTTIYGWSRTYMAFTFYIFSLYRLHKLSLPRYPLLIAYLLFSLWSTSHWVTIPPNSDDIPLLFILWIVLFETVSIFLILEAIAFVRKYLKRRGAP